MIAKPVSASQMPRLPVSWREFSELLRIRTSESMRPAHEQSVEAVTEGELDIRSNESGNQQNPRRYPTQQSEQPSRQIDRQISSPANSIDLPPIDLKSSRAQYPNGFEAFA